MSRLSDEHRRQILLEEPARVALIFNALENITPKQYVCYRACGPNVIDGHLACIIHEKGGFLTQVVGVY